MRKLALALLFLLPAPAAFAQEPVGCDKFKWPLEKERALLTSSTIAAAPSGAQTPQPIRTAVKLSLVPFASAKLPIAPERAPKSPDSFAGWLQMAAPAAGEYKVSVSSNAWIDVVQNGKLVKSGAFSGALGCEGIRKSVKFTLAATPFSVQVTGVPNDSIAIVVTPAAAE
jgi:hypothetical protein